MAEQKTVKYDLRQVTRWVLTRAEISPISAGCDDVAEFRRRDEAVRVLNSLRRADPECWEPQAPVDAVDAVVQPLTDMVAIGLDAMLSAASVRVLPAERLRGATRAEFRYGFDRDGDHDEASLMRSLVGSAYQWLEQACFGDGSTQLRRPHDVAWIERPRVYDHRGKRCISFAIATMGRAPDADVRASL
ncbi:hypothetical protein ABNQ39_00085 (plasmid) [Azospirillum sp. A26]|uniref:hypothetical protein n=1 Tax=Azospirillum sp. A26 TaxID=3160607 RepID=UPI00366DD6CF